LHGTKNEPVQTVIPEKPQKLLAVQNCAMVCGTKVSKDAAKDNFTLPMMAMISLRFIN